MTTAFHYIALQNDPLISLLTHISQASTLTLSQWNDVIRLARTANVISRLACSLDQENLLTQVPEGPRQHLESALALAQRQRIAGLAEIKRIQQALASKQLPTLLLKGAAYLALDLPVSHGRIYGDIDLLFAQESLPAVESALLLNGWNTGLITTYDERYYRQWMHELPPYIHVQRGSVLDVHHNILPSTAKNPPDARLLLANQVESPLIPGVFTLAPADMVLHSACHLFHEGELENGLRDLSDLDMLLRDFGTRQDFWAQLLERAHLLHLERPLHYAVRMTQAFLKTPIPEELVQKLRAAGPHGLQLKIMDSLYLRGLRASHPLTSDRWTGWARWLLYVRAHWLRMPPHLLTTHLIRKAWFRWTGLDDQAEIRIPETEEEKT